MRRVHPSAWLLAISSGILQILVFPTPDLTFLCWVALAPLIYAILRAREVDATVLLESQSPSFLIPATPKQGFVLGWTCGVVWYLGTCYWVFHVMHLYGGLNPFVSFLLLILFSLYLGLNHGIFGALLAWAGQARAGFSRRALVLAPFLWVTVELIRTYVVGFPWDLLGTAQVNNIPLSRLATVTGVYGLSFEIALVNTVFAATFLVHKTKRKAMIAAALVSSVALQTEQFVKFDPAPTEANALLVQQNVPIREEWTAAEYDRLLANLSDISILPKEAQKDAGLIVWPESPAPFFLNDPQFVNTIADVARKSDAYVIAGSIGVHPRRSNSSENIYNSAALVSPQGAVVARYDKVHLVPFGEYVPFASVLRFAKSLTAEVGNFVPGTYRAPLTVDGQRVGVFICYESVFPGEVRQFAERGADVFVNISNDGWFGNTGAPWQHLNMARMRAIENDRWLLRDTNTGITAVVDPLGRVVQSLPRNRRGVLKAGYGRETGTTFYTRYGDWFPILCAIISIVGLFFRFRERADVTQPQPV
ncbi:MAG: apolipoprotein N-acyltransferase [Terriglobia bacterium]|nr:apolipoprotein N-acyltransferase [Terriglobia bacterium]